MLEPFEMAKQERFVTGDLPDDFDIGFSRRLFCALPRLQVIVDLVAVEQNRFVSESRPRSFVMLNFFAGALQARKRIASAETEFDDPKIDWQP